MLVTMTMMTMMRMLNMLSELLGPCVDLVVAPCLDLRKVLFLLVDEKLICVMMTALQWMVSSM